MKQIALLIAVAISLTACKTKTTTLTQRSTQHIATRDTAHTRTDSTSYTRTTADSSTSAQSTEASAVIEFIAGGGVVVVDSAGKTTLYGVKRWQGIQTHQQQTKRATTAAETRDNVFKHTAQATQRTEQIQHQQATTTTTSSKSRNALYLAALVLGLIVLARYTWTILPATWTLLKRLVFNK